MYVNYTWSWDDSRHLTRNYLCISIKWYFVGFKDFVGHFRLLWTKMHHVTVIVSIADTLSMFIINSFVQPSKMVCSIIHFCIYDDRDSKFTSVGLFFVFLIRKWANLIGLCLMDDSLLCLMTDLWPFIGTRSSMGIFLFLLYGRPECINDFWRNLEKISKRIKTHMWFFMYSCIYTNHCCKSFWFTSNFTLIRTWVDVVALSLFWFFNIYFRRNWIFPVKTIFRRVKQHQSDFPNIHVRCSWLNFWIEYIASERPCNDWKRKWNRISRPYPEQ